MTTRWLAFLSALAVLPTPATPAASSGAQSPTARAVIAAEEFVFERAPFASAHASTIVETADGLVAAWFGGSAEGHPDVGIWASRHDGARWLPPAEVTRCAAPDGKAVPCWNPVLFQPVRGRLLLFYKAGPSPREWWGLTRASADGGRTWSAATPLPAGILGPIRAKPVEMPDGSVLAGSSTEDHGWVAHVERWTGNDPAAPSAWSRSAPLNDASRFSAIQPTILLHSPREVQVLCRSRQGVITEAWSGDGGRTWGPMAATRLPNPSAGIDAVRLGDGRFLLAYNPTSSGRGTLALAVSADGREWRKAVVVEDDAAGEYSYPALIQARDGRVHLTYTWRRERIRHVVLDPAAIR